MLFGPSGVGKSILAVQIGEALARGRNLEGFRMPTGRRRVLYVDLVLRDEQFQARYSYRPPQMWPLERYRFAERLYRDRPRSADDLCDWLRATVRENRFEVVIIDDLSALSRTADGTRETLALMRELRRVRDELNISILVLTDSAEAGRSGLVRETDLKRSRVLCRAADSVFAIGRHPRSASDCYLVQTRSACAPIFWTEENAPVCRASQDESGFLRFVFDERFAPRMSESERLLICRVKALRVGGLTYREVEKELGVSKSQAARLYKKWTPAMGEDSGQWSVDSGQKSQSESNSVDSVSSVVENQDQTTAHTEMHGTQVPNSEEPEEREEAGLDKPVWLEDADVIDETPKPAAREAEASPPERPSVYDLKRGVDGYGREIFIQSENSLGQPAVWHKFDEHGNNMRYVRGMFGVNVQNLGANPYL